MTGAQFLAYVKSGFQRNDADAALLAAYNDAIQIVLDVCDPDAYKATALTNTVAADYSYAIPAGVNDILHPLRVSEGSGSSDESWPMEHVDKTEFDRRVSNPGRSNPTTQRPYIYTIFGGNILINPPDSNGGGNYVLELDYLSSPVAVTDGTAPLLSERFKLALKWATLWIYLDDSQEHEEAERYRQLFYGDPAGLEAIKKAQRRNRPGIMFMEPNII